MRGEGSVGRKERRMSDLISRHAAIDALGEEPMVWTSDDEYELGLREMWRLCKTMLEGLPSAEKKGKWKQAWDDLRCCFVYECSACGQPRSGVSEWNYCPNCGARMDL